MPGRQCNIFQPGSVLIFVFYLIRVGPDLFSIPVKIYIVCIIILLLLLLFFLFLYLTLKP